MPEQVILKLKVLANEDTLLPTQMFPRLPARATFVADTNFVSGTQKENSDFVQKHFVSATNVSQFAQPINLQRLTVRLGVTVIYFVRHGLTSPGNVHN